MTHLWPMIKKMTRVTQIKLPQQANGMLMWHPVLSTTMETMIYFNPSTLSQPTTTDSNNPMYPAAKTSSGKMKDLKFILTTMTLIKMELIRLKLLGITHKLHTHFQVFRIKVSGCLMNSGIFQSLRTNMALPCLNVSTLCMQDCSSPMPLSNLRLTTNHLVPGRTLKVGLHSMTIIIWLELYLMKMYQQPRYLRWIQRICFLL